MRIEQPIKPERDYIAFSIRVLKNSKYRWPKKVLPEIWDTWTGVFKICDGYSAEYVINHKIHCFSDSKYDKYIFGLFGYYRIESKKKVKKPRTTFELIKII